LLHLKPVGASPGSPPGPTGIHSAICWIAAKREFTIAAYISGRTIARVPHQWNTLEELRLVALSRGCTPAQFAYTVEVMGTDTHHVANYLQRHLFMAALPANGAVAA
jgi:hypothetical protein